MWMWPKIKLREGPEVLVSCFPGFLYDITCMWECKRIGLWHLDWPLSDYHRDSYTAQYFLRAAIRSGMLQPKDSNGLILPGRSLH